MLSYPHKFDDRFQQPYQQDTSKRDLRSCFYMCDCTDWTLACTRRHLEMNHIECSKVENTENPAGLCKNTENPAG